jgi:hypothetical protein
MDTIYEQVEAERLLSATLRRLNARVMGFTLGCMFATGLFLATLILILEGGQQVGAHLNLLGHYFPLYSVSWTGLPLALIYGWITGFVGGYLISRVYNAVAGRRGGSPGSL